VVVYRISGAFFFGATASVSAALERIGMTPRAYVLDFSEVPVIDSTAAATLRGFVERAHKFGTLVFISGASLDVRRVLSTHHVGRRNASFYPSIDTALAAAKLEISQPAAS